MSDESNLEEMDSRVSTGTGKAHEVVSTSEVVRSWRFGHRDRREQTERMDERQNQQCYERKGRSGAPSGGQNSSRSCNATSGEASIAGCWQRSYGGGLWTIPELHGRGNVVEPTVQRTAALTSDTVSPGSSQWSDCCCRRARVDVA